MSVCGMGWEFPEFKRKERSVRGRGDRLLGRFTRGRSGERVDVGTVEGVGGIGIEAASVVAIADGEDVSGVVYVKWTSS